MTKVTLNDVQTGYNSTATTNSNYAIIEKAFDNTLSRDGTSPNQMEAVLDMNTNRIINLAAPANPNDAVRLQDLSVSVVASNDALLFSSKASATAAKVPSSAGYVQTAGYATPGDSGGGVYARVLSQPTHDAWFQTADGAFWELASNEVWIEQLGASPDNPDNSANINSAAVFAALKGKTLRAAAGPYTIKNKCVIRNTCRLGGSTWNYAGDSSIIAVEVSTGSADTPLDQFYTDSMELPSIVNLNKTTTGWLQTGVLGTVGLRFVNPYRSRFTVPKVSGFETNMAVLAVGSAAIGAYYNQFFFGDLADGKIALDLTPGSNGTVNENLFYGGRFFISSSEGTQVADTRFVVNPGNGNKFMHCAFEGNAPEFHIANTGQFMDLVSCRYEAGGGGKVRINDSGQQTCIVGGVNPINGVTWSGGTNVTGSGRAMVQASDGMIQSSNAGNKGVVIAYNRSADSSPAFAIFGSTSNDPMNAATSDTSWTVSMTANGIYVKNATDSQFNARTFMSNSSFYVGDGTAAITTMPRLTGFVTGGINYLRILQTDFLDLNKAGAAYKIANLQVVGPRISGWTTPTGTATRTGFATSTATTANVAEALMALIQDLKTHGLLGA